MELEDKDTSFDYGTLHIPIELIPRTFRNIFECPCLSTETKNKFARTFFTDYMANNSIGENLRKICTGKYIVFINFEYVGLYTKSETSGLKRNFNDIIVLFNIGCEVRYFGKTETLFQSPCVNFRNRYPKDTMNHNYYLDCNAYFYDENDEKINICEHELYMYDTGASLTSLNISQFLDYTNLKFLSTVPPNIKYLNSFVDTYEFINVETSNGILCKIKFLLRKPIYFKIETISEIDIEEFTVDIPSIKFNNSRCFPGRYLMCCFKNSMCDTLPLLGLNALNKLCCMTYPIRKNSEFNSELLLENNEFEHNYSGRINIRKIIMNIDDKDYQTITFRKGFDLVLIRGNENIYIPPYINNEYKYELTSKYFRTVKSITLICLDNDSDIEGYFKNRITDGYYISNDVDNYIFLNYENCLETITYNDVNFTKTVEESVSGMGMIYDNFSK